MVDYVRKKATVITYGDSITAFSMHRGETVPFVSFMADVSNLFGGTIPQEWANQQVNIGMYNVNSGYTTTGNPNEPYVFPGTLAQAIEGFTSVNHMGLFVDALINEGIDIDLIEFWEYACGGTTAFSNNSTPGAWAAAAALPTQLDSVGGLYGIVDAPIWGGFTYNQNKSIWLSKQVWLQGTGHPYEEYTFCDAIAHCPTEHCIVIGSMGGNDMIDLGKQRPFMNPYNKAWDPYGVYDDRAAEIKAAEEAFCDAVHMLNPNAEVYLVGYPNFCVDGFGAPDITGNHRNFRYPYEGSEPNIITSYGWAPAFGNYWPVYAGDGPVTVDPYGDGIIYENWFTLQSALCTWPTGAVFQLPITWTPLVSYGFARGYFAGMGFTSQKDAEYDFMAYWVGRQFANQYAWQMEGTAAFPGHFVPTHLVPNVGVDRPYPGYYIDMVALGGYGHDHLYPGLFGTYFFAYWNDGFGPTYNYTLRNQNHTIRGAFFTGHGWDQIQTQTRSYLIMQSLNTTIVVSGGAFINFHQAWTVMMHNFTTKNFARIFRDTLRPIHEEVAASRPWVHHLDVWDDVDPEDRSSINSQDDPDAYPVYPGNHYCEGLHLSSIGAPKWCRKVAQHLLAVTLAWKWEKVDITVSVTEPPEWKFTIGPGASETFELAALDRRMRFELKDPSTVDFTLNLLHPSAAYVLPLQTDLKVYRGNDKVFRGRIGPMSAKLDPNSGYANFSAMDYRGVLDRRLVYEEDNAYWYEEDVSTIVWDMIQFAQFRTGGSLGLAQGMGFPILGITRGEIEFQPGDSLMASLKKISENKVRGFDWDIDPDMIVHVWNARGDTTIRTFDYTGAITEVSWDYDTTQFANAARATSSGSNFAEELETVDVGTDPRGRWEAQLSWPDVETQEILEDRTQYLLEQSNVVPEEFTFKLRQGHWQGPNDLWLGDAIRVAMKYGALSLLKSLRVHNIEVSLDESGREDVLVTAK